MAEKQKPMNGGHKLQPAIRLNRELSSYCSVVGGVSGVDYLVAVSPFRQIVLERESGKPCAREKCPMAANQSVDPDFGEMLT